MTVFNPFFDSSALFALPILGYVVGSVVVAYVALRTHRYIRQRRSPSVAVLPRPANENAAKKSVFSVGRATGWDWRRWAFAIPWSRSPGTSTPKSKAAVTAAAKNLSVELLPTTGLPPPPTSVPSLTPTPQLVDLGSPTRLPEGRTSSGFSSFPSSPRLPSRLLLQPISHSHPARGPKNIQYPSFPRPPSPHTLFATTPPPKQGKRSRSLGGVPVRRLSGGPSGLRNALDVEMSEFVPGHARGGSQERLLIDFSSPESSEDDDQTSTRTRISPAASDIGVMPVSSAYLKPIPMPLVDVGSDSTDGSVPHKLDSEAAPWMWLGPSTPSIVKSYDARVLAPRLKATPFSGEEKFVFPIPLPFPKIERLVDVPPSPDENFELVPRDFSNPLVDFESDVSERSQPPNSASYVVETDLPDIANDPFADDHTVDDMTSVGQPPADLLDVGSNTIADGCDLHAKSSTSISQPLLKPFIDEGAEVRVEQGSLTSHRLAAEPMRRSSEQGLLFAEAESHLPSEMHNYTPDGNTDLGSPWLSLGSKLPSPSTDLPLSAIEDSDVLALSFNTEDPWSGHVSSTISGAFTEAVEDGRAPQPTGIEGELVETSLGGSLFPTLLEGDAADEQVPEFNLDNLPVEELLPPLEVVQENVDEGDVTPRPTPASDIIPLPTVDEISVPVIIVGGNSLLNIVDKQAILETTGDESQTNAYPDPDLLPLPEFHSSFVPSKLVGEIHESIDSFDPEQLRIVPQPSSQMPTPPASPPSISPIRLSPVSSNLKKLASSLPSSPRSRTNHLGVGGSTKVRSLSRPTSPLPTSAILPSVEQEDRNENSTPVALVPKQPLWDVESSDGINLELETKRNPLQSHEEAMETMEIDGDEANKEIEAFIMSSGEVKSNTALPGSFPEHAKQPSATSALSTKSSTTANSRLPATLTARLVSAAGPAPFHPSVRAIVRQPVEIALAMQLRPGLGAGADPAWMVRFLMAMFGWFAVLVSGQENY